MKHRMSSEAGRFPRRRQLTAASLIGIGILAHVPGIEAGDAERDVWQNRPANAPASNVLAGPAGGPGGLTLYSDLAAFEAATAMIELSVEDFAGGFSNDAGPLDCFQALGSDTNDACFGPRDLEPGFAIRSSRGSIFGAGGDSDLVLLGPSFLGTPTRVVGAYQADPPVAPTHVNFEPDVVAVSMDVYDGLTGQTVSVTAFAEGDVQIGTFTVQPPSTSQGIFAGFTSDTPIDRVEINALSEGGAELIGNLRFGGRSGGLGWSQPILDVGTHSVGTTHSMPIELRNTGDLPLQVPTLAALPAPFAWSADGCSGTTVSPDATCSMTLDFMPTHEGQADATAGGGALREPLLVVGTGLLAQLTPSPGHLEFGVVAPGGQSAELSVEVNNFGGSDVVVDSLTAHGPFERTGGSCGAAQFTLDAGDRCTLDYRFAPGSAGDFAGHLELATTGGATTRIGLSGRTGSP